MAIEQGLFRQEVMTARRGEWLGTIHIATPWSRWIWTSLGVALAAAIVAFLVFGRYTQRARVNGQLIPTTGVLEVTTVAAGTVTQLFVHQGQNVHQGDPLLEISGDRDSASLGSTRADISAQLHAQVTQLDANLATQKQRTAQQVNSLQAKIRLLRVQQAQVQAQLDLQSQQVTSAKALLDRIRPLLDKGYVSAFRVDQQHTTLLNAKAQRKTLARQELDIRQQIQTANQNLAQLPLDLATQTNTIAGKIATIKQQLAQNEAERASVLRAPRDGVVATLLTKVGQHVAAGQSLASVVPHGGRLEARLLVPSRAVGFVDPGSRVVLRYQAYPYQKFGQQYGHVTRISDSALGAEAIVALTGQRPQEPLYRVDVALDRQDILAYGKSQALRPGMAFSADILMDRRRLIEWIFEPLYGIGRRLQGEDNNNG
jgi:membrane fusion protein